LVNHVKRTIENSIECPPKRDQRLQSCLVWIYC